MRKFRKKEKIIKKKIQTKRRLRKIIRKFLKSEIMNRKIKEEKNDNTMTTSERIIERMYSLNKNKNKYYILYIFYI